MGNVILLLAQMTHFFLEQMIHLVNRGLVNPTHSQLVKILQTIATIIGGWGVRPTVKSFRFVSFRSCVRAGGLIAQWNSNPIQGTHLLPFPFCPAELSLFPFPMPPQLPIQL